MPAKPPLLELMLGNLADALRLGLIDDSAGWATSFRTALVAGWPALSTGVDQSDHLDKKMYEAAVDLDAAHRPIRSPYLRPRRIATVMQLRRFAVPYMPKGAASPSPSLPLDHVISGGKSDRLKDLAISTADTRAWAETRHACLDFNANWGEASHGGKRGTVIQARDVWASGIRMWVATSPKSTVSSGAQDWRDRLGLIHLRKPVAPTMGDACLLVNFKVTPKRAPLNRLDWKATLKLCAGDPDAVWLLRPTMIHKGNRRFVQAHADDDAPRRARPCVTGRTRDLASPVHAPGEREMLLVSGPGAEVLFCGIQLLEGIVSHVLDSDDDRFLADIRAERHWP